MAHSLIQVAFPNPINDLPYLVTKKQNNVLSITGTWLQHCYLSAFNNVTGTQLLCKQLINGTGSYGVSVQTYR
jgi:hypothetical protein